MNKREARTLVRERKKAMSAEDIRQRSARLAERFFALDVYRDAKTLYGYLSYNQEVLTLPILRRTLLDGKAVAVPKVVGQEMRFILLEDLSRIGPGFRGIPEPLADGPEANDPSALVLMPGLAFDPAGHRVGYGGGFYDRLLTREPGHPTVALCYDFQVFPELSVECFDQPVDLVLWA